MNKAALVITALIFSGCTLEIQPSPDTVTVDMLERRLAAKDAEQAAFRDQVQQLFQRQQAYNQKVEKELFKEAK